MSYISDKPILTTYRLLFVTTYKQIFQNQTFMRSTIIIETIIKTI